MGLGGLPMWVRRKPPCAGEGDTLTVVSPGLGSSTCTGSMPELV